MNYAFLHNEFFGGRLAETRKGYSLYTLIDGDLLVKETTFTDALSVAESIENALLKNSDRLVVNYPPYENADGILTPFGMILAVDYNAEKIMKNINNAYLGLTLE